MRRFLLCALPCVHALRTLVVLTGTPRGGVATWESLDQHLLQPNDADLALLWSVDASDDHPLVRMARWVWPVREYEDWGECLDELSTNWRPSLERDDPSTGMWGGVAVGNATLPGSGAIGVCLRAKVAASVAALPYDRVVWTRTDLFYACDVVLPTVAPNEVWIPNGPDYGGVYDRWLLTRGVDAARALNLLPSATVPTPNPEALLLHHLTTGGLSIRRFPLRSFVAAAPGDRTRWRPALALPTRFGVHAKYPEEVVGALRACDVAPYAEAPLCLLSAPHSGSHALRFVLEFLTGRPTEGCLNNPLDTPIAHNAFAGASPLRHVASTAPPVAVKYHDPEGRHCARHQPLRACEVVVWLPRSPLEATRTLRFEAAVDAWFDNLRAFAALPASTTKRWLPYTALLAAPSTLWSRLDLPHVRVDAQRLETFEREADALLRRNRFGVSGRAWTPPVGSRETAFFRVRLDDAELARRTRVVASRVDALDEASLRLWQALPFATNRLPNAVTSLLAPPLEDYHALPRRFFLHQNKCGGTTFKAMLRQATGNQLRLRSWAEAQDGPLSFGSDGWVVGGFTAESCLCTNRPCGGVTLFRHPFDRFLSAWNYCRTATDHLCDGLRAGTLLEGAQVWARFARSNRAPTPCAQRNERSAQQPNDVDLERAYVAIGLVDDYERSIRRFEQVLGLRLGAPPRLNAGSGAGGGALCRDVEAFRRTLGAELDLYEQAVALYERQEGVRHANPRHASDWATWHCDKPTPETECRDAPVDGSVDGSVDVDGRRRRVVCLVAPVERFTVPLLALESDRVAYVRPNATHCPDHTDVRVWLTSPHHTLPDVPRRDLVVMTGDEQCLRVDDDRVDARTYYAVGGRALYLPLGPSLQWWTNPTTTRPPRDLLFSLVLRTRTNDVRDAVARTLAGVPNSVTLVVNDTHVLHPQDFRSLMERSTFVVCPPGTNEETFRLHETILSGAIPVILRGGAACPDGLAPYADAPFLWVDDVDALHRRMVEVDDVDSLARDVARWYAQHRRRAAARWEALLFSEGRR